MIPVVIIVVVMGLANLLTGILNNPQKRRLSD
jgi:hypothetical protein